jgi:hypothetical protein
MGSSYFLLQSLFNGRVAFPPLRRRLARRRSDARDAFRRLPLGGLRVFVADR